MDEGSEKKLIIPPSMELSKLHEVMDDYKELSEEDKDRVLLLLGQTGVGKSSFVNYVVKNNVSEEAGGYLACTKDSGFWDTRLNGHNRVLRLVDTPGLFDPERNPARADDARYIVQECDRLMAEFERAFFLAGPQLHAVGLVLNIGERFSLESQMMIEVLKRLKIDMDHVILVFTHGDSLFEGGELPDNAFDERYKLLEQLKLEDNLPAGVMKLLIEVHKRFVIVEKYQPGEHDKVLDLLLQNVEEIANKPLQNGRFNEERLAWKKSKEEREAKERERQLAQEQLTSARIKHQALEKENLESKHKRASDKKESLKQLYAKEQENEEIRGQHKPLQEDVDRNTQNLASLVADVCISRGKVEQFKYKQAIYLQNVAKLREDIENMYLTVRDECVKPKVQAYIQSLRRLCEHRSEGRIQFQEAAKALDKYFKSEAAVRIAGATAGVAGGVVAVVGLGLLIPVVTIPGGVVLLVGGLSLSTVGGVASVGVSIVDIIKKNKAMKAAHEWILEGQTLVKDAILKNEYLEEELKKVRDVFPQRSSEVLASCLSITDTEDIESFHNCWISAEAVVDLWRSLQTAEAEQVAEGMVTSRSRSSSVSSITSGTNTQSKSQYDIDVGRGISASTVRTAVLGAGVVAGLSTGFTVVDIVLLARASRKVHKRQWHTRLGNSLRAAADDFEAETEKIRGLVSFGLRQA